MIFTCHTTFDKKTLTIMARAVRKTMRAKRSRRIRLYAWSIIGLLLVATWLSWGNIWQTAANCVVIVALLLINWKEDAINGYFAKHKIMSGTESCEIKFYPTCFYMKNSVSFSKWKYDKILAMVDTGDYFVLVMGKNHAVAIEKANLKGGSILEFSRFIEEKSGQIIQNIVG